MLLRSVGFLLGTDSSGLQMKLLRGFASKALKMK